MKNLKELLEKAAGERSMRKYALDAGMTPSLLSLILSGRRVPTKDALAKLTSAEAEPRNGITYRMLALAAGYGNEFRDNGNKVLIQKIEAVCNGREGVSLGIIPDETDTPVSINPDFVTLCDDEEGNQQEIWNYVISDMDGEGAAAELGELISGIAAHRKKNRRFMNVIVASADAYNLIIRYYQNRLIFKIYLSLYDEGADDIVNETEL